MPNTVSGPPTNENLNAYLEQFYQRERTRQTQFPEALPADAQPFDLLVINICSLAWSDLDAANLANSPLWSRFDMVFSNFNSATSYSGPASIRLLRASCGQTSHHDLYQTSGQKCYLFDDLARLGFGSQLAMDHTGEFGNYIKDLRKDAGLQAPLMSQAGLGHNLTSFDGSPIYNDGQLFTRWLENQQKAGSDRTATFFNLVPLHDGNRFVGTNKPADYRTRAETLFTPVECFYGSTREVWPQSDAGGGARARRSVSRR
ncbi:cellulose synthase operon protein YhjU [Ewingella americana]|uniref:Cellulose synthase operon protein YhjU n=1 Tax=Ewingella americana TaxID=41202 RepID=A0A377NCI5_9GAMM|nr:cellulose synthase operon protein YhjU [Ewingella americana]